MGVQRDANVLARIDIAAEILDLIGVGVGSTHLNRGRQIQDDLAIGIGLPDIDDRITDLDGILGRSLGEDLGRVLIAELDIGEVLLRGLNHPTRAVDSQLLALFFVNAEDHPAEQFGDRVVHVDGAALRTDQRLSGALNQIGACLGQHRDGDIIWDSIRLDQRADEIEIGLRSRREPDLDLLVAHANQQIEQFALASRRHRVDQRLVSVAQIGRQPARGMSDRLRRPLTISQHDRMERLIADVRHGRRLLYRTRLRLGAGLGIMVDLRGHDGLLGCKLKIWCQSDAPTTPQREGLALASLAAATKEERRGGALGLSHAPKISQDPTDFQIRLS